MKNSFNLLTVFIFLSINTAISQSEICTQSYCIDHSFLSECPTCPTEVVPHASQAVPCFLDNVTSYSVTGVDFNYVLIFDDEFAGDAIDLSKWNTAKQATGLNSRSTSIDYDNGENFQFDHPGVEEIDKFSPGTYDPYNNQYYNYTSSQLESQYQFPLLNNTTYSIPLFSNTLYPYQYGIYQLTATLPPVQTYSVGFSTDPPYGSNINSNDGSIWPAFWMWGTNENTGLYGEIDGFEFSKSKYDDLQTVHYPDPLVNACGSDFTGANFGDNSMHKFTSIETPDEIDWWVDVKNTRADAKYYGEDDPLIGNNTYFPIFEPPITSANIDKIYKNCIIPNNVPMWLIVDNWVQSTALPEYFPVNFKIRSIQYWVPGNCGTPANITAADIQNYNTLQFNVFTGTIVTIDGTSNAIIIPKTRNIPTSRDVPHAPTHGNIEAISINSVQIKGTFYDSGYMVLKANANMCNEFTGPYPFDDLKSSRTHRMSNNQDSDIYITYETKKDSLSLQVKNSITNGQFSVILTNIGATDLDQNADVTVFNMLGQQMYHGNMIIEEDNMLLINLSNKASGVYLVIVKTNNTVLHKSIILQ